MLLGFKTTFDGQTPTDFKRKILWGEKIHTIRAGNRWKPGTKIHFATGVRTDKCDTFKVGECIGVQDIEIRFLRGEDMNMTIFVDDKELDHKTILELAKNDGLTIRQFIAWFNKEAFPNKDKQTYSFKGQIITWTNHKY